MARTSFYNDNAARDYPFVRGTPFFPVSAVVECVFQLGETSGFLADTHQVRLVSISRSGSTLSFRFTCDAPGLTGVSLTFDRDVADEPYTTDNQSNDDAGSVSDVCPDTPLIDGLLVTGPLGDLLTALPGDGELTGTAIVEPANCRAPLGASLSTIGVANLDRTRYTTPDDCPPQEWPELNPAVHVHTRCLTGRVRLVEGYNMRISSETDGLRFHASVGAGAGEPCAQTPLHVGETAPDDSIFLEGGAACNEVVRNVNGLGGPVLELLAGLGVSVQFDPENHRIVLTVDGRGSTAAFPDDGLDGLSCSETLSIG